MINIIIILIYHIFLLIKKSIQINCINLYKTK